jgi:hypothetical protein
MYYRPDIISSLVTGAKAKINKSPKGGRKKRKWIVRVLYLNDDIG